MGKNTSILLGEHYEKFIDLQVRSGRYTSASEVIRAALRQFEEEESKKQALITLLEEGEKSGFPEDFDRVKFLDKLHQKYASHEAQA